MTKQIVYLVLVISLVGQSLLTPLMAAPKLLHSFSHSQVDMVKAQKVIADIVEPRTSSDSDNFNGQTGSGNNSQNCHQVMQDIGAGIQDCDAICSIIGAGHCATHCVSAPAIMEQTQLSLAIILSHRSVQAIFWSLQTAEQSLLNRPPILTLV